MADIGFFQINGVVTKPYSEIALDWFEHSYALKPKFRISCSNDLLSFEAEVPLSNYTLSFEKLSNAQFVEGLWEKDVAELFVSNGDCYQEFNFSPSGAWWTWMFTDYRERSDDFKAPSTSPTISSVISETNWKLHAEIPSEVLQIELKNITHAQVCFILNSKYFCTASNKDIEPDFHRFKDFNSVIR